MDVGDAARTGPGRTGRPRLGCAGPHRPGRLRPCQNAEECTLFLIDRSKSNSARWCSMAQCGNRMKARRHYERARGARSAG
ncbi:CGNR zinc finger domain-containing protein [Actinacidiphila sp. DG2A-62]|uniref:CGNR zinc finger domain-containing protein n=1 Tax=Actinacidiphila sp. DG2A-62 TaxID=3108821 RepID=UPI002DB6ECA7|nr:CGNR zinc finger domain-containing protein [Actinacidiphila sp. DG2A-62]MEC3993203.1 CGNR zinc finger domain-containing protein [Actinacidiphila sp. DG2A-62]